MADTPPNARIVPDPAPPIPPAPATHPERTALPAHAHGRRTTHVLTRTCWVGWVAFASIMMILIGTFQALAGLLAIFDGEYFLVTRSGVIVTADYSLWGWTNLVLGAFVALAGLALTRATLMSRVVGVVLTGLSAVANLLFVDAYPMWNILVIALDVMVIFALVVHGAEVTAAD